MPPQTNDFQELITLLTKIIGKDNATRSAMLPDKVTGVLREVDILVRGEVSGHEVLVGIECRAWKEKQSATWVEEMHAKHALLTDKLVLVSSSGFYEPALVLAEHYGIKAVTPGEVTPGFIGEIVNNLEKLWVEKLDFVSETITFDIDPPVGDHTRVEVRPDTWASIALYLGDSTAVGSVGQLVTVLVNRIDVNQVGELPEDPRFTMTEHKEPTYNGQPLFLQGGDDPDPPTTLRRITGYQIDGRLVVTGADMPLEHRQYDGTNYSSGVAVVGDSKLHFAVTEGDDGPQAAWSITSADELTKKRKKRKKES